MPVSTVSIPVGQWLVSAEGTRWWFDSGSFALDFAYTGAIGGDPALGAAARPRRPHHVAARAVPRRGGRRAVARPLRRDLAARRDRAHGHGRRARRAPRARPTSTSSTSTRRRPTSRRRSSAARGRPAARCRPSAQALSTIARDAVDLFDPANAGRIRECNGGDCEMVYLDTSRAATRRWCSMQRCGNRAKVRAHRAREGGAGGLTDPPSDRRRVRRGRRRRAARARTRDASRSLANRTSAPEALLDELDRAARRADEVRRRVAQPLEGGARDRGLGRRVVDAEADEGVDDRAGGELVLDREPDRRRRPRHPRGGRALARGDDRHDRALATLLLQGEDPLRDRRAVAQGAREHDDAALGEPRGERAAVRRREHHRAVELVDGLRAGEARRRERGTRFAAATGHDTAEPFGECRRAGRIARGHGATGTPRSAAATTAVVNDSTSTTTTTCAPGRMRSAPAAPQSNRTWYFAWPNGALESLTGTG